MSEFGAMNVADSLKKSWVDGDGKPLKNVKASDLVLIDRLNTLEGDIADIKKCIKDLSDSLNILKTPQEKKQLPEKKPKKVKK